MVVSHAHEPAALFGSEKFTQRDSVLVVNAEGGEVYAWLPEEQRTPASVVKLVTAWAALDKWGAEHRFETEFFVDNNVLWVRGSGDPMLIAEEMDIVAEELNKRLPNELTGLSLDASLFDELRVPGRGSSNDPYNAPLSALSINFNTVSLKLEGGKLRSGEPQTPLTGVAREMAKTTKLGAKPRRVNLGTAERAQRQFAEVLLAKLSRKLEVRVDQTLPNTAELIYRHKNTRPLAEILRGTLEFSNNFIANQLFLLLGQSGETSSLNFELARDAVNQRVNDVFAWSGESLQDGAGLSRDNRLSARQVMQVLDEFESHRLLLREYPVSVPKVKSHVRAKSGTLSDVHSLAGYIRLDESEYQFVFLFDRQMPYRYREQLLKTLVEDLAKNLPVQVDPQAVGVNQ